MNRMLLFLVLALSISGLHAQDSAFLNRPTPAKRLWHVSLASLAVANVVDIESSWGKHELNSTLAGGNGTFGARGALIKSGIQGGLMGAELPFVKRRPSKAFYRVLTVVNFGAAAVISGTAVRNYGVPR